MLAFRSAHHHPAAAVIPEQLPVPALFSVPTVTPEITIPLPVPCRAQEDPWPVPWSVIRRGPAHRPSASPRLPYDSQAQRVTIIGPQQSIGQSPEGVRYGAQKDGAPVFRFAVPGEL